MGACFWMHIMTMSQTQSDSQVYFVSLLQSARRANCKENQSARKQDWEKQPRHRQQYFDELCSTLLEEVHPEAGCILVVFSQFCVWCWIFPELILDGTLPCLWLAGGDSYLSIPTPSNPS